MRNWPPFVLFSLLLHIAMATLWLWQPSMWPWCLSIAVGNHLLIAVAGLWPRSRLLGANWTRLPHSAARRGEIAITIDDGPDPEVTPLVLDLLDRAGAKASFFCIGARAQQFPELCRAIAQRGHAVENHSMRHRHTFSLRGFRFFVQELSTAQNALHAITGMQPRFFRAPAGLRNPFLDPALRRCHLQLAAWTRRGFDTRCRDPQVVLRRLTRGLGAGDILLLHDGHAARTVAGVPVILEVLPPLLEMLKERHLRPVTLDAALRRDQ